MGPQPPDVSVVVVTFNSAEVIGNFLAALPAALEQVSYELVVADNASDDETVQLVSELAGDATLVPLPDNRGYAAGINAALRHCRNSRAVLVANPDIRLTPGSVRRMLQALDASPDAGIVVPRLVDGDGRLQWSLRREPTLLRALGEALLGGQRAGRFEALGEVVAEPGRYERPGTADWACGAIMLIASRCLQECSWDESFFLYSEETDFMLRARDAGFLLRYLPGAVATHVGGGSHLSPPLWTLLTLNRLRLYADRHGPAATAAYWFALLLNESIRALLGRETSRAAFAALLHPRHVGARLSSGQTFDPGTALVR